MKILLIAYYFPPLNTGGTTRPLKMAKFLEQFGHEVTVLTHTYEQTRFTEPAVIRIKDISNNKNRKGFKRFTWLLLRLYTEALNRLGIYHSIYSWWKGKVIKNRDKIMETVKPGMIIASYPPVETLETGLFLSKEYNIPLISDFRDGLLFEPIEEKRIDRYPCIKKTYEAIEKAAAEHSSAVITITNVITGYFSKKYPGIKVETISNGFDPDDFTGLTNAHQPAFEPGTFNIVHTGRFGLSDTAISADSFFQAIREMIKEKAEWKNKIKIHLAGELNRNELASIQDLIEAGVVIYYGLVKRQVSLALQKEADVLFIVTQPTRTSAVSAKIFEYLYAAKPILALTHKTAVAEIIEETGTGWVIYPNDKKSIRELLEKLINEPKPTITPNPAKIREFSMHKQIKKLDELLKFIGDASGGPAGGQTFEKV